MSNESMEQQTPPQGYWSTLSEYDRDIAFQAAAGQEFFPAAKPERFFEAEQQGADPAESLLSPMHRRTFMKMSGFAAVAAAVAGCERPVQEIIPYVNKPEEIVPGLPNFYATTCTECAAACGVVAKAREGRPVKLEGNPDHPMNRGALCTKGQASILSLYDPDRMKYPLRIKRAGNFEPDPAVNAPVLDAQAVAAIRGARGKVVLLSGTLSGPSDKRLLADFKKAVPGFEHVMYDPLQDGLVREIHEMVFGRAVTPHYNFLEADVVVTIGGDPLAQSWSTTEVQKDFGLKRHPQANPMSRVYSFEPAPTLTGMKADYRHMTHPAHLLPVAYAIAHEVMLGEGSRFDEVFPAGAGPLRELLQQHAPARVEQQTGIASAEIERVAASLRAAGAHSLIYTNGAAARTEDARSLHLVATLLNYYLGAYGTTIDITQNPSQQASGSLCDLTGLVADMNGGRVSVLLITETNPVYTLPEEVGFAQALAQVETVIYLGRRTNETSALADFAIPGLHGLENWGDAEPLKGLYSIQQPLIRPIFGEDAADPNFFTRAWQETLMAWADQMGSELFRRRPPQAQLDQAMRLAGVESVEELDAEVTAPQPIKWRQYVQETWEQEIYNRYGSEMSFGDFWIRTLQIGILDVRNAQAGGRGPQPRPEALGELRAPVAKPGTVVVAAPNNWHGDGESMGNPHLLELPDPVSKVAWDNYFSVSPAMAKKLGVDENGEHLSVKVGGVEIVAPAYIQPGMHPDVIAAQLGWGRKTYGGIGDLLGYNGYPMIDFKLDCALLYSNLPAEVTRASGKTELADVQGHNYLYSPTYAGLATNKRKGEVPEGATTNEAGKPVYERPIIGETTLAEWKKNPYAGYPNHVDPGEDPPTMWEGRHRYVGHHWGMTVDLSTCIGCNACVVACSIENNVPVVGKEEVLMGREMHWIRIDRYYRGDKDDPDFAQQPLMCQHCDNAPCETVCPVVATMHNDEGLNVMVYNRCVGTRYCANNCPYKVRRFNFWQYSDYRTGPHENEKMISPLEMVLNPDVTTRTRGVMEKCTFCIQRIRHAKYAARAEQRAVGDGDLQTACQQTCPSQAIVFGDRNNPETQVARLWDDPRAYGLLADLNTDPSVKYLAVVRHRDEPSPYRTKYQSHRFDHGKGHGDHGHDDHGAGDHGAGDHGNEESHGAAASSHGGEAHH